MQLGDGCQATFMISWKQIDTFRDGSKLYRIPVSELSMIKTWSGNRYINMTHIDTLRSSGTPPEEFEGPYTIVQLVDDDSVSTNVLIDGQHRRHVRCFCEDGTLRNDEGTVLIQYYSHKTELETVEIFKKKNTCFPFTYRASAIEKYHILFARMSKLKSIAKGTGEWVGKQCIKTSKTTRPRLCLEDFQKECIQLKWFSDGDSGPSVEYIMNEFVRLNKCELESIRNILNMHDKIEQKYALNRLKATLPMLQNAIDMDFGLAIRVGFPWLKDIIIPHDASGVDVDLLQLGV